MSVPSHLFSFQVILPIQSSDPGPQLEFLQI